MSDERRAARFHIGDSVHVVRCDKYPELIGATGRVTDKRVRFNNRWTYTIIVQDHAGGPGDVVIVVPEPWLQP